MLTFDASPYADLHPVAVLRILRDELGDVRADFDPRVCTTVSEVASGELGQLLIADGGRAFTDPHVQLDGLRRGIG